MNIKQLRKLIREFGRERISEYYESSEDDELGKYAFAPNRDDVPEEENNEFEEDLYQRLVAHFDDNTKIPTEYVDAIEGFLRTGKYDDVFHEPTNDEVFRGMSVAKSTLRKFLNFKMIEDSHSFNTEEGKFLYTSRVNTEISSWTVTEKKAITFIEADDAYAVIFVAKVSDNPKQFIACENGLYDVKGFDFYSTEREVLGIGDIKVHKILWKNINANHYKAV